MLFNGKKPKKAIDPAFLAQRVNRYRKRVNANPSHILQGRQPRPGDITMVSNDYLDLGSHPDMIAAQVSALEAEGHGLLRSDVYRNGHGPLNNFEHSLALLMGSEAVALSQSGWAANVGLMQSLAGEKIPVYLDMYAHFSIWEGVKSAGARARPFKHNDPGSLESMIKRHGPGVVVFETVYSTDGSVGPVKELVKVGEKYGCALVVDESHSLGVYGRHGEGMVAALGLTHRVHFRTASLSKAFASRGGIIAGSAQNLEFFQYEALPAIFSSCVLPYEAAGFSATLKLIRDGRERRLVLHHNADYLRDGLLELGYNVTASQSPIISLEPGTELETIVLRDALEIRGVFGSVFCWPATPRDRTLIRFSLNSGLSKYDLAAVLQVCSDIRDEINMWDWKSTRQLQAQRRTPARSARRA